MEQIKKGNVTRPLFLTLPVQEISWRTQFGQGRREVLAADARRSHEEYWNRTAPGKKFEH